MLVKYDNDYDVILSSELRKIVQDLLNETNFSDEIIEYEVPIRKKKYFKRKLSS